MAKAQKIDPEKFYTPSEACELGVISGKSPNVRRQMLLRNIRDGKITAINVDSQKKPRYVVQGKHLLDYQTTQLKPGSYLKK